MSIAGRVDEAESLTTGRVGEVEVSAAELVDEAEAPQLEMSSADRRKIFVETRRFLFTPVDFNEPPRINVIQVGTRPFPSHYIGTTN